ncbi:B12-binding domain-containing radical SAM protein [Desulfovibrio inopinatus]|uniref:B12-binding domain-containing radical SAM protein n=1 Tax=Desulfovibrio inopinatus TaxID=102109 RepID=UPI00041A4AFF|nr:B12-binding domain-containing radical SAM protein [Desulfovibrio inopinatus]
MSHIQLVGLAETKPLDGKLWKLPFAFPIIISQLQKTTHTFDHLDTYLNRLTLEELSSKLQKSDSRIFGISAWSHNYLHVKQLSADIRKAHKDAIIIVGGIISGNDQVLLEKTDVDIVSTCPEGESVLPDLLDELGRPHPDLRSVNGISFKDNKTGTIVRTESHKIMNQIEFQNQEFPAYEYFDEELKEIAYNLNSCTDHPVQAFPILTSRGCPFHCTFCGHLYGHRMLRKKWETLLDEFDFLINRYGFTGFYAYDTNMFLNAKDIEEYCQLYDERGMNFKLIGSLRLSFGSYDLYKKLADHGVAVGLFGLETGSQDMLKRMKKNLNHQEARQRLKAAIDAGITMHGNFIFGTPGENVRTIAETRSFMLFIEDLIEKQKRDFKKQGKMNTSGYGWTILIPSPSSELYHEAMGEKLITDEDEYLTSLSDEKFQRLLTGSSSKIALAQEAGNLNMSEFTSRRALAHYIKFNWHYVKVLAALRHRQRLFSNPKAVLNSAGIAAKNYVAYLFHTAVDTLKGRKGYVPRDKRGLPPLIPEPGMTSRRG